MQFGDVPSFLPTFFNNPAMYLITCLFCSQFYICYYKFMRHFKYKSIQNLSIKDLSKNKIFSTDVSIWFLIFITITTKLLLIYFYRCVFYNNCFEINTASVIKNYFMRNYSFKSQTTATPNKVILYPHAGALFRDFAFIQQNERLNWIIACLFRAVIPIKMGLQ